MTATATTLARKAATATTLARKATTADSLAKVQVDEGRIAALQMTAHAIRRAELALLRGEAASDETAMADSAERALAKVYGIRLH